MVKNEIVLTSPHNQKTFGVDYRYVADGQKKPVILFVHGFKGFKDAMHFNAIADVFATSGFVFVKMNLSHNGVAPDHPVDFMDLEAFSNNNFTIELDDIAVVMDHLTSQGLDIPTDELDTQELYLIGHSRGGAVCILKACEDTRVKKLVTWAAVPDLESFWSKEFIKEWKSKGIQYIKNTRTQQDMPMRYQIVEDFENHCHRFRISEQLPELTIPYLALHGSEDETVSVRALALLKQYNPRIHTCEIKGANHTFGGKHPWTANDLPQHTQKLVHQSIHFLTHD